MKIVVVGGGLQGSEAAYLAGKAGWETTVIDRRRSAPAAGLCDYYVNLDLLAAGEELEGLLAGADLLLPALENLPALDRLEEAAKRAGVPLAYDPRAYRITSSKKRSDALFAEHGIPAPQPWPGCGLPVIAKPSESSGSRDVSIIDRAEEVERLLDGEAAGEQWVIQQYLPGDSYSIEVFGCQGNYLPLQVTDLRMDSSFDCRCVTAPTVLPFGKIEELRQLAVRIARLIKLKGIMDVEVIEHRGLKVLEIDARLPSQTPAAVYHSSGINMLTLLGDVFVRGRLPAVDLPARPAAVIYEHILVEAGSLQLLGEHVIAPAGPLQAVPGFFGADEGLTDYCPGARRWVATLIFKGNGMGELRTRRRQTLATIAAHFQLQLPAIAVD
jgi:pyrrolysine biosynthesis protein PylC